jgi:hypothetical protein
MDNVFLSPFFPICMVIDTTICPIERPGNSDIQQIFYSGKHKLHGVKYEIGVNIRTGVICWIAVAPGSMHDLTIARQSNVFNHIPPGKKSLGDKAYIGEDKVITLIKQNDKNFDPNG